MPAPWYDNGQQAGGGANSEGAPGAVDGHALSNASATGAQFQLTGGKYMALALATWGGGSVTLSILGPDGTTFLTVATFSANGGQVVDLPPGVYKWTVTTATAVYTSVSRCPQA